jgi:TatD DNase family protein
LSNASGLRLIDSHAHLGDERFDDDRAEVLRRAREAGVEALLIVGYNADSSAQAVALAEAGPVAATSVAPALYATAGFAPHNVGEADESSLVEVDALLARPRVVAVGEIGLDYHYDMPRAEQRDLFDRQVGLAVDRGLPVVVHSREAEDDVLAILGQHCAAGRCTGVIHCFTESERMAATAVDLGFYVSFAGILTFRNAAELREIAAGVPLESTLIETDSPYLAPVPHRGKRNEPAFVAEVARTLAQIHERSPDEVAEITGRNARELFSLPGPC